MASYNNSINNTLSSLTFIGDTGIIGITDGSSAPTGSVGESIISQVPSSSAISISAGVNFDLTSINLTAGTWNLSGNIFYNCVSNNMSQPHAWISTTSATNPTFDRQYAFATGGTSFFSKISCPVYYYIDVTINTNTTFYLSGSCNLFASTTACGFFMARRVR